MQSAGILGLLLLYFKNTFHNHTHLGQSAADELQHSHLGSSILHSNPVRPQSQVGLRPLYLLSCWVIKVTVQNLFTQSKRTLEPTLGGGIYRERDDDPLVVLRLVIL